MSKQDEWLVAFRGRGRSKCCDQNFVWKSGNIYIMDNHRAASWCWCQHIRKGQTYSLLHIDAHYDAAPARSDDPWFTNLPDFWEVDLKTALSCSYRQPLCPTQKYPCLWWDNYLTLFMKKYPGTLDLEQSVFATQMKGDHPRRAVLTDRGEIGANHSAESEVSRPPTTERSQNVFEAYQHQLLDIPSLMDSVGRRSQWICNVDLDYFFFTREVDGRECVKDMFSTSYVECVFASLKSAIESGRIVVFTMALSPECCGGWEPAEKLARLRGFEGWNGAGGVKKGLK